MKISEIINESLVVTNLEGDSKEKIINALIDVVGTSPKVLDIKKVRNGKKPDVPLLPNDVVSVSRRVF